ncbi:MAG: MmgE/PrpD family protein [Sphingomonas sp.]
MAWPEAQYTCFLIPAVFTLAASLGASGKAAIEAVIIGFEVAARPGMVCSDGGAAARGFLSCANVGTLGVAAASAKLMGLDLDRTVAALTLAASVGGGLVRQTGSAAHVVEAGFAARDGIMAAELARRGLGGNPGDLRRQGGLFRRARRPARDRDENGPRRRFPRHGGRPEEIPLLLHAATHHRCGKGAARDAPDRARRGRRGPGGGQRRLPDDHEIPGPADVEQARFSLPHVVAATLAGEPMDVRTFSAQKLDDPRILAQRGKVRMVVHDEWGYDQLGAHDEITVVLRDGSELKTITTIAHGDAIDPLSRAETLAKFHACTAGMIPARLQGTVAGMLEALEAVADVAPMMRSLTFAAETVAA